MQIIKFLVPTRISEPYQQTDDELFNGLGCVTDLKHVNKNVQCSKSCKQCDIKQKVSRSQTACH